MGLAELTTGHWFALARHELLLFAAVFFVVGACDELVLDATYLWLKITGRARSPRIDETSVAAAPVLGPSAVLIPAWCEERVIAATICHASRAWPQAAVRFYVGCYRNDPATIAEARSIADADRRIRVVLHERDGPTCKADCLNRMYRELVADEERDGQRIRMVILHDAEDMVDPAALVLLDQAIGDSGFVQLPVMALPQRASPLVAGHYTDEFAEHHTRTMVVRSYLGNGIPGAGVGCAVDRGWLARLDQRRGGAGPFVTGALTEDYQLGLEIAALGGRTRFLRARTKTGRLIATRAYFPCSMTAAIRQKTRWVHGIAFQGWDTLGWYGGAGALWMQLRDRRGPFAAMLLAIAYLLVVMTGIELALRQVGNAPPRLESSVLDLLLTIAILAFVWRLAMRVIFTTREFGPIQGLLAIPRVIVGNTISIVAAPRALAAYVRALRGGEVEWDKTEHSTHPATSPSAHGMGGA